jgi:ABC-type antimicrobial peptide transport system permease subunit
VFILYAILIGLALGIALGGRPLALAEIRFRWAPLVVVGFLAQVVLFSDAVASQVGEAGPPLYVASTLLVGAAVVRNLGLPGMPLIVAGAVTNMAAILANGGFMPATPEALGAIGKGAPTIYSNSAVVAEPALGPLIDRFALPMWLPFHNVFSVGDVLLAVGVAILIAVTMRRSPRRLPVRPALGAPVH